MSTHKCHVPHCNKTVPPHLLMCGAHWKCVPQRERNAVWKHYRKGQEVDKKPSPAYVAAAQAAIEAAQRLQPQRTLL